MSDTTLFRAVRVGTEFKIEDTTTHERDGRFDDFFVASQEAKRREDAAKSASLSAQLTDRGRPDLAEAIERGINAGTLLRRLRARREDDTPAARTLKEVERPPRRGVGTGRWG